MTAPSGNNPASMIPASQRPDGTWRKARRVKDGYVPQEEKPVYESKGTKILRSIPSHPLGLHPEDIEKHNINKKIVGMAPTNEEARAKEKKEKKKNNNKGGAGGKKKEDAFEITFEMPWLKIDDEESGANKTKKENKENVKASSSNKKSNAKNEPKEGGAKKDKSKEDKTNQPEKKEVPKAKNDSNKDKTNNTNKTKSKKKK